MAVLSTLQRAGEILELFSPQHPEWGVRQVARSLEIPKSNAHQLLASLEAIGLLHRMVTGRYRLGFKILTLGQYLLSNTPWRDVARRAMIELEWQHQQTTHLGVLDGGQLIFVDQIIGSSANAVPAQHPIGTAIEPHNHALGKVLLASKPARVIQTILESKKNLSPDTNQRRQELEQVNQQGYALHLEGFEICLAAPIRNHNGDVIAAIGISVAPQTSQIPDELRNSIVQTGALISKSIAYDPEFVGINRTQARMSGRVKNNQ